MKIFPLAALVVLCVVTCAHSEPSEKEIFSLINKVQLRLAGGEVSALNDLTTLPGKWAAPTFLSIFDQNYNVYGESSTNRAIAAKCAFYVTTASGCEEYLGKLLTKKPDNSPNWLFIQQDTAINALIRANNKVSVRLFCNALDEPDIGNRSASALATMGLPGAPFASKNKSAKTDAEGVAKWKTWWAANKDNYTGDITSPTSIK